mgnify:CR=1 FL=1
MSTLEFNELLVSYKSPLQFFALKLTADEEEAKDIVQESFISVWNKIGTFNIDKNFSNWLYRIIVNKCYDSLRRKKRISFVYPDENNWNIAGLFSENDPERKLNNKKRGEPEGPPRVGSLLFPGAYFFFPSGAATTGATGSTGAIPSFSRILFSISLARSGLSSRNARAFSLP